MEFLASGIGLVSHLGIVRVLDAKSSDKDVLLTCTVAHQTTMLMLDTFSSCCGSTSWPFSRDICDIQNDNFEIKWLKC